MRNHDIQSLGIDRLQNAYAASGLAIREKTQVTKLDALKEMIRALGMNPDQVIAKNALVEGATNYADSENQQLAILRDQLRQLIQHAATV